MKKTLFTIVIAAALFIGYSGWSRMQAEEMAETAKDMKNVKTAVFSGGCFWCTESDFEKADGVIKAVSGYTGGNVANPGYEQVSAGGTGHVESVKVYYDPAKTSYRNLLDLFWRHVNPTDARGQFVDRGSQYRSVIWYAGEQQKKEAEASKKELEASRVFDKPIVTEILPLGPFYPAEEYHQDYYKKNPSATNFTGGIRGETSSWLRSGETGQ